jgi:vitamin B12 transporter
VLHNYIKAGFLLLIANLFVVENVWSQSATDTLKEVRIKSKRKELPSKDDKLNIFAPGQKIQSIDSLTLDQYQFQSIANLLAQQVPVFVKSYGINSLATLSFRGASAAQSQVYWNGVPIQNAALGIADVSLLPVSLANRVNVVYGGSSALWGSGNVGGAVMLETDVPDFDEDGSVKHSVSAVAGSFGQYQLGIRSSLSTEKWALGINASGQTAKNDFSYTDNGIEKKTSNAALSSGVLMLNGAYKVDEKNKLGFNAWYQQYYREIPKALFESTSLKNQRDESLRLLGDWKRNGSKADVYAKTAFIRDYMLYDDTLSDLHSENITNQLYAEAGIKYRIRANHQLLAYIPVHISWIEREITNDVKTQNKAALALAYDMRFFHSKLDITTNLRGEIINDLQVILPGLSASYALTRWFSLRGNVQRSFRAPSLNELYYVPGGNDKLKPEKGWSEDVGYVLKLSNDKISFTHDLSVFNRVIDNWILWFGGSIWTPHNIATVHSRGVETENKLEWQTGKWKWHLELNTSYVLATTQESYIPGDGSIDKQIPYAPRYNGQANAGFMYRGFYLNYNHTYTGYRFITTDESLYLLPYNTGNLQLLYTLYIRNMPLQLTAQGNNIWNKKYSVVNDRPMPGFNWQIGARATIAR